VSGDGGSSWKTIYSRTTSTNGWARVELPFGIPGTDKMQLRFSAQDLSASLVEACVDDVELHGIISPADTTVWGAANRGRPIRVVLHGIAQGLAVPLIATNTGSLTLPGIKGTLLLDPLTLSLLPALPYGTTSTQTLDVSIPNDSSLTGVTLYWQQLLATSGTFVLGNRTSFRIQ
jgi:hypothetical protein